MYKACVLPCMPPLLYLPTVPILQHLCNEYCVCLFVCWCVVSNEVQMTNLNTFVLMLPVVNSLGSHDLLASADLSICNYVCSVTELNTIWSMCRWILTVYTCRQCARVAVHRSDVPQHITWRTHYECGACIMCVSHNTLTSWMEVNHLCVQTQLQSLILMLSALSPSLPPHLLPSSPPPASTQCDSR